MTDVIRVDLTPILKAVHDVERQVHNVDRKVDSVAQEAGHLRTGLAQLHGEFLAYIRLDALRTEVQLAETRLVKVRQEIEGRFGHYAEVRRSAVGILQATDVSLVREETMRSATEEAMLTTPRYWLSPVLVALTAWIADRRELSERALAEALRRDPNKVCLFFALVCRRAARPLALSAWLEAYLSIQDPVALDREVVVLLDALASGLFGGAALVSSRQATDRWLAEFEQRSGFLAEQQTNWSKALSARRPIISQTSFTVLRKYSPTWPSLEMALSAARRNGVLLAHFKGVFQGDLEPPKRLTVAVDELLDSLTGRFDDEELPLRREERRLTLIVENEGDREAAERRINAEESTFAEKVSFVDLLTGAAMTPEMTGASRATQRYAITTCRSWILAAQDHLVASDRASVPFDVEIGMGDWRGASRDGQNEAELVASLEAHYANKKQNAIASVGWGFLGVVAAILGGLSLLGLLASASDSSPSSVVFPIVMLVGAAFLGYAGKLNLEKRRQKASADLETEQRSAIEYLRAALAELADFRRQWSQADAEAGDLHGFLISLLGTPHGVPVSVPQRPVLSGERS